GAPHQVEKFRNSNRFHVRLHGRRRAAQHSRGFPRAFHRETIHTRAAFVETARGPRARRRRSAIRMTLPYGERSVARILVTDDQELNIDVLTRILERAGFTSFKSLTDPERFMEVFAEYSPDLVLLDLHMPRRDGFQILKDLAPHLSETFLPVLILTGDASAESKKSALTLGAKDFLAKPFDQGEVLLRIHNLLEARSLYLSLEKHNAELGT